MELVAAYQQYSRRSNVYHGVNVWLKVHSHRCARCVEVPCRAARAVQYCSAYGNFASLNELLVSQVV